MPLYGPLEALLRYPLPPKAPGQENLLPSESPAERPSLEGLLEQKINALGIILGDVARDISSRQSVSIAFIERLYVQYFYIKAKFFELSFFPIGGNRAIESRRSTLEKQLDALVQEKRQEQVRCWQDIAALKKEFRVWLKQYSDLVSRAEILMPEKHKT